MNLPTKITVSRIILTPLFLVFFMLPQWVQNLFPLMCEGALWGLTVVSVVALWLSLLLSELSDAADGYVARRYNLVTDLGKLLDPFSDVFSRITYFACFLIADLMPFWVFMVILYREMAQLFVRQLAVKEGVVIPANIWGKAKAIFYAVASIAGLAAESLFRLQPDLNAATVGYIQTVLTVLFVLSAVASVASFLTYLVPFVKMQKGQ